MPNRIIKESICSSEKINSLTDFQFRLWVGLITYVDDYGRGDARPAIIKGHVFPLRDAVRTDAIAKALPELERAGCIRLYSLAGRPFLCFPKWDSHQRIRQKVSRFPAPPECTEPPTDDSNMQQVAADRGERRLESESESESNTNPNTNTKKEARPRFTPPTLEEVKAYCEERQSSVDPVQFFEYFSEGGWVDSKGNHVKNWKQKLLTWEKYQPGERAKKPPLNAACKDYGGPVDMDQLQRVLDSMGGEI